MTSVFVRRAHLETCRERGPCEDMGVDGHRQARDRDREQILPSWPSEETSPASGLRLLTSKLWDTFYCVSHPVSGPLLGQPWPGYPWRRQAHHLGPSAQQAEGHGLGVTGISTLSPKQNWNCTWLLTSTQGCWVKARFSAPCFLTGLGIQKDPDVPEIRLP